MNKQKVLSMYMLAAILLAVFMITPVSTARTISSWTPVYEGVWTATGLDTTPRLMRAYAIRVDLANPWLCLYATPSNGSAPLETTLQTTPAFRSAHSLEAAVNANWFSDDGANANNCGLLISNGTTVSPAGTDFRMQLNFTQDIIATLVESTSTPSGIYTAVGGQTKVLSNGSITGSHGDVNPRTVMGISEDGRFLIMVVIDGRQSGYSMGVDDYEAGKWLQDFGAYNGCTFDGGGSSCICTASGGVLNSPSDGSPRAVGTNLGVDSLGFNPQVNGWAINYGTGQVISRSWNNNEGWTAWANRGNPSGTTAVSVCTVSRGPGLTAIFVLGANGYVYQKSYDGGWGDWVSAGAPPSGVTLNSIDVCASGIERMYLVGLGSNGTLYRKTWIPSGWGSWASEGGGSFDTATRPSIVSWGLGRLDIFAKQGSNIMHKYFNGSSWSSWITRSGWPNAGTGIDAVSDQYGKIYIFYTAGTDHTLRVRTYNSSGTWSSETNLGGLLQGGPGACTYGENKVGVYCRDHNNGSVYYRYFNGSWQGWANIGNPDSGSTFSDFDGSSWSNDSGTHFP